MINNNEVKKIIFKMATQRFLQENISSDKYEIFILILENHLDKYLKKFNDIDITMCFSKKHVEEKLLNRNKKDIEEKFKDVIAICTTKSMEILIDYAVEAIILLDFKKC